MKIKAGSKEGTYENYTVDDRIMAEKFGKKFTYEVIGDGNLEDI